MISAEDSLNELLAEGVISEEMAKRYADDPKRIGKPGQTSAAPPAQNPNAGGSAMPNSEDISKAGKAALGAMRNMFGRGRKDGE